MTKIDLTKCRAGFYYYFTATAQYILTKEGNQWALYNAVQGAIKGDAIATSRCLSNLKAMLAEYLYHQELDAVDSEIDTQDNEPKIEDHSITSEATVTSEVEPVDSEIDSNDNEPDGDDLHYPSEIDTPDPDFDHDTLEVDYPDYQLLLDKFKEENPHFTVLESKFFTVPYWHLTEQKLLIFGYGGEGNKWNVFSVISFTTNRTNHIFDGNYQQSRLIYQEYCGNTANFKVYPPRQKDPILERYKQELTPDYRVFTRKQLALF